MGLHYWLLVYYFGDLKIFKGVESIFSYSLVQRYTSISLVGYANFLAISYFGYRLIFLRYSPSHQFKTL